MEISNGEWCGTISFFEWIWLWLHTLPPTSSLALPLSVSLSVFPLSPSPAVCVRAVMNGRHVMRVPEAIAGENQGVFMDLLAVNKLL